MTKLLIPIIATIAGLLVGGVALLTGAMIALVIAEEEVCKHDKDR